MEGATLYLTIIFAGILAVIAIILAAVIARNRRIRKNIKDLKKSYGTSPGLLEEMPGISAAGGKTGITNLFSTPA